MYADAAGPAQSCGICRSILHHYSALCKEVRLCASLLCSRLETLSSMRFRNQRAQ
jgi:hypothetical protein